METHSFTSERRIPDRVTESGTERFQVAPDFVAVCFSGAERSRRMARAYSAAGKYVVFFEGGTKVLSQMAPVDIKKIMPKNVPVHIIYEDRSKQSEYEAFIKALDKLKRADIPYQRITELTVITELRELGVNWMDYF